MTQKNISFSQIVRRAMMVAALCGLCSVAHAASDGCDDENNNRITAELALCSVHAYNIGQTENQTGSERQLMKDVVALKTTVITQQMDKQYEYMESMIRRLKTQLEKAVLTTKLQAAGAAAPSASGTTTSGGGYTGGMGGTGNANRNNNGLANAEDCMNSYGSTAEIMQCLLRNITKIQSAVSSGDIGLARRQLDIDITVLQSYNHSSLQSDATCEAVIKKTGNCAKVTKTSGSRNDITTCLGSFRACIIKNTEALQRQNNQGQSRQ